MLMIHAIVLSIPPNVARGKGKPIHLSVVDKKSFLFYLSGRDLSLTRFFGQYDNDDTITTTVMRASE